MQLVEINCVVGCIVVAAFLISINGLVLYDVLSDPARTSCHADFSDQYYDAGAGIRTRLILAFVFISFAALGYMLKDVLDLVGWPNLLRMLALIAYTFTILFLDASNLQFTTCDAWPTLEAISTMVFFAFLLSVYVMYLCIRVTPFRAPAVSAYFDNESEEHLPPLSFPESTTQ